MEDARLRWRDGSGSWVQVEGTLGYDPQTAACDNGEALARSTPRTGLPTPE